MKPKYKIGDRVIWTRKITELEKLDFQQKEHLSQIEDIHVIYDSSGVGIIYNYNSSEICFSEEEILCKLAVIKPRKSRAKRAVEELKKMNSPVDFILNEMNKTKDE